MLSRDRYKTEVKEFRGLKKLDSNSLKNKSENYYIVFFQTVSLYGINNLRKNCN